MLEGHGTTRPFYACFYPGLKAKNYVNLNTTRYDWSLVQVLW